MARRAPLDLPQIVRRRPSRIPYGTSSWAALVPRDLSVTPFLTGECRAILNWKAARSEQNSVDLDIESGNSNSYAAFITRLRTLSRNANRR